jgi:hypothetical protein
MKFLMTTFFVVFYVSQAFAGDKGNGGDAVVCFNNQNAYQKAKQVMIENYALSQNNDPLETITDVEIENVQLLDLFESESELYKLQSIELHKAYAEIEYRNAEVSSLISELPSFYNVRVKSVAKSFIEEIYDSKPTKKLPNNCLLMQLGAVYYEEGFGDDLSSIIVEFNERLLNRLNVTHRVAWEIHELIMAHAMNNYMSEEIGNTKPINSIQSSKVRSLVRAVFLKNQSKVSFSEQKTLFLQVLGYYSGVEFVRPERIKIGGHQCFSYENSYSYEVLVCSPTATYKTIEGKPFFLSRQGDPDKSHHSQRIIAGNRVYARYFKGSTQSNNRTSYEVFLKF